MTKLFALDCDSQKIAIAIFEDGKFTHNILIYGGKKFDADIRARNIYNDFCKFLDESKPDEVVIERSVYLQSFPATRSISEVIGLMKLACGQRGIPFSLVHNTSWKKFVAGKGNATKQEIKDAVVKLYPEMNDRNQDSCDACGVGLFFLSLKKEEK